MRCSVGIVAGVDDGDRQMVAILSAVLNNGLAAVEAACTEALLENVYLADVILNIMARQRGPAVAITIKAPAITPLRDP